MRQPFLMLKMSEFFRYGKVDEMVERNALLLRKILGHTANGGHQPEGALG